MLLFGDVLSEETLARQGLFEPRAVTQLLKRAERLDGTGLGEREEMGLIGALTLSLLDRHFHENFSAHVARALNALGRLRCEIFVDQCSSRSPEAQILSHQEKRYDGSGGTVGHARTS
jgi:hypothetical protein